MSSSFISLVTAQGAHFQAFVARPERPNGRGLVLVPEVYNINEWVQDKARDYADHGYTVLVSDLYWRTEPAVHLGYDQAERARALGAAVDQDGVVADVGVAAAWLRSELGPQARVGVLGFCLGGRIAVLAGASQPIDVVISYYGVEIEEHLDTLQSLRQPTLLHFGETDPWVDAPSLAAIEATANAIPNISVEVYRSASHGFARRGYGPYVESAARSALERDLALLGA